MKKFLSLVISLSIILSCGIPAYAATGKLPTYDTKKVKDVITTFFEACVAYDSKTFKAVCKSSDADFVANELAKSKVKAETTQEYTKVFMSTMKQNKSLKYYSNLGLTYDVVFYTMKTEKEDIEKAVEIEVYEKHRTVYVLKKDNKYYVTGIEDNKSSEKRIQWEEAPTENRDAFIEAAITKFGLTRISSNEDVIHDILNKSCQYSITNDYAKLKEIYPELNESTKIDFEKYLKMEQDEKRIIDYSIGDMSKYGKILPNASGSPYQVTYYQAIYAKSDGTTNGTLYLTKSTDVYLIVETAGKPMINAIYPGLCTTEYISWSELPKELVDRFTAKIISTCGVGFRLPEPYKKPVSGR